MTFAAMYKRLEARHPPSLQAMLEAFDSAGYLTEFVSLIRKFVPRFENEILRQPDAEKRCTEFIHRFEKQYNIELAEYDLSDEAYQQLLSGVPIILQGLGDSDYENIGDQVSPEWVCMAALVIYPYWVDKGKDGSSERIPILEETAKLVGANTTDRIPAKGFKPEELHKKLDKTKYEGLAWFAEWLCGDTGCWKLDVSYEDNPEGPDWDEETVAELVRQEPIKIKIEKKVTEIEFWLHEDLRARFAELVSAVVGRPESKEQLNLPMEVKDD